MPNKLSQFWQELKRRNVVRVITVYAGAAFVILELVDIIAEPLKLPDWLLPVVIVLLSIGFIIAVILSWIYDIHPEGGMVKTEPAEKVKAEDIPKSSNSWKVASYISFVVIVGLIVLNVIPRAGKKEILDKSVAVLPFINDSQDQENEHFISGIMDELLINLQTIKDLRVPGRTSTEQYRNNPKTIPEIATEMNVSYIVVARGQRYGEKIRLRVHLVDGANDTNLWADSYDEEIKGTEDIFRIQSKIAQSIAAALQAVITPAEKERIENIPTTDITALDFYQRGNEAYWRYWSDESDTLALERAEYYFNEALKYDPTFAQAYTGLARIHWGSEGYFSEDYLDTARVLLDKALSFDPGLAEAHTLYGRYFNERNDTIRAMREVDKAISLNPNGWEAYSIKADISSDYISNISNSQKAVLLNRGPELPGLLTGLGESYWLIGFLDKAEDIYDKVLQLTGDSIAYLFQIANLEYFSGNTNRSLQLFKRSLELDSTQLYVYAYLFQLYHLLNDFDQAIKYGKKWVDGMKASGRLWPNFVQRVGLFYRFQGLEAEAETYFNLQIEYCLREIELGRRRAERNLNSYYDLATTYAAIGETEKAIENLRIWLTRPVIELRMFWYYLREDPILNPIRDEPEFQQILNEAESKYQAEHERVRQWLEEDEMI